MDINLKKFIFKRKTLKAEEVAKLFKLSKKNTYIWGLKKSGINKRKNAIKRNQKLIYLEDSFIRSTKIGYDSIPYGICLDDKGIYYDCKTDTRLEELIIEDLSEEEKNRAI